MSKVTKLKLTDLKRQLKQYDQKELIGFIAELYKQNNDIQHYLSVMFLGDEVIHELQEKAEKEIEDEFFPDKGFGKMRLVKAKKAISDFKKLTNDHERTVDLMLFYVEIGTEFTNTYGDIDERFYDSMNSMYFKVIDECEKDENLFRELQDRLHAVVVDSDGTGWGYHDGLKAAYHSLSWLEKE
jgi:hypothetical protein